MLGMLYKTRATMYCAKTNGAALWRCSLTLAGCFLLLTLSVLTVGAWVVLLTALLTVWRWGLPVGSLLIGASLLIIVCCALAVTLTFRMFRLAQRAITLYR